MADKSAIEWTDATWNPVTGCTKVSPGCDHCYAERIVERFKGKGTFATVVRSEEKLYAPLKWRKPRRVFVNSMADLFHDDVPLSFIERVFSVMARTPQHTYQILTKRHARMSSILRRPTFPATVNSIANADVLWPLPNVWLGVSVEDQRWADIRIPALLQTPAAVRFLSCEPLLGPVDLVQSVNKLDWLDPASLQPGGIDWVIVGGESGPGARPMHPDWARTLRDQCQAAGVPYFFKQHGEWVEARRDRATHLLHVNGSLVDRANATTDNPYGEGSGLDQDLVDRGHPGWVRVRRVGKKAAGRELDGRTWDEYPGADRADG